MAALTSWSKAAGTALRANTDASDAGVEVLRRQRELAEPVPADWAAAHRVLVNDGSLADLHGLPSPQCWLNRA